MLLRVHLENADLRLMMIVQTESCESLNEDQQYILRYPVTSSDQPDFTSASGRIFQLAAETLVSEPDYAENYEWVYFEPENIWLWIKRDDWDDHEEPLEAARWDQNTFVLYAEVVEPDAFFEL